MFLKTGIFIYYSVLFINCQSLNDQLVETKGSIVEQTYDTESNTSKDDAKISYINVIKNPSKENLPIKICADFTPIKSFFDYKIEPLYEPIISLLPESYQLVLLEETRLGRLNVASCSLLAFVVFILISTWYYISNLIEKKKIKLNLNFQNEFISLKLQLNEIKIENEILRNEAFEKVNQIDSVESLISQKDNQIKELEDRSLNLENLKLELEKSLKQEMDNLRKNLKEYETNLENLRSDLKESENKLCVLNQQLVESKMEVDKFKLSEEMLQQNIQRLEHTLIVKNSVNIDSELKTQILNLELELSQLCADKQNRLILISEKETKLLENERIIKELEMQIKLLNDLREKDTKQHVKQLSELDIQLKKKSNDSEKLAHLYEQLRNKQERIVDLESQIGRLEKNSVNERQTYEKQAHENWLNAKKFEKELKETRNELSILKDRFNELNNETNQLKQQKLNFTGYNYSNLETSLAEENESGINHPLQIDTNQQLEISRPSSATSSSSGFNSGIGGPHMPVGFIRAPIRFPFPIPPAYAMSSPNPDMVFGPRLPYNYVQNAQMMYKMMMSRSANSSQLPSPGANFPSSASFPNSNALNESMTNFSNSMRSPSRQELDTEKSNLNGQTDNNDAHATNNFEV